MSVDPKMTAMATSLDQAIVNLTTASTALKEGKAEDAATNMQESVKNFNTMTADINPAAGDALPADGEAEVVDESGAATAKEETPEDKAEREKAEREKAERMSKLPTEIPEGKKYTAATTAYINGEGEMPVEADIFESKQAMGGKKKKRRGGKSQRGWKKMKKGGRQSKKHR